MSEYLLGPTLVIAVGVIVISQRTVILKQSVKIVRKLATSLKCVVVEVQDISHSTRQICQQEF